MIMMIVTVSDDNNNNNNDDNVDKEKNHILITFLRLCNDNILYKGVVINQYVVSIFSYYELPS